MKRPSQHKRHAARGQSSHSETSDLSSSCTLLTIDEDISGGGGVETQQGSGTVEDRTEDQNVSSAWREGKAKEDSSPVSDKSEDGEVDGAQAALQKKMVEEKDEDDACLGLPVQRGEKRFHSFSTAKKSGELHDTVLFKLHHLVSNFA